MTDLDRTLGLLHDAVRGMHYLNRHPYYTRSFEKESAFLPVSKGKGGKAIYYDLSLSRAVERDHCEGSG